MSVLGERPPLTGFNGYIACEEMIFRATITPSRRPRVRVLHCPPSFSFGKYQGPGFRPTQNSYGSQPPCCAVTQKHNVNASIFSRCSGILLHVTSLPGGHGIGDLGDSAYEFIEFLAQSQQKIWQVLPRGPTGYGPTSYSRRSPAIRSSSICIRFESEACCCHRIWTAPLACRTTTSNMAG